MYVPTALGQFQPLNIMTWIRMHNPVLYLTIGLGTHSMIGTSIRIGRKSHAHSIRLPRVAPGEAKINRYCRDLAVRGGKQFTEIFGMEEMDKTPSHELMQNMVQKASDKARSCAESRCRSMCNSHPWQRPIKWSGIGLTSYSARSHSPNGILLHQLSITIITGGSIAPCKSGMR